MIQKLDILCGKIIRPNTNYLVYTKNEVYEGIIKGHNTSFFGRKKIVMENVYKSKITRRGEEIIGKECILEIHYNKITKVMSKIENILIYEKNL